MTNVAVVGPGAIGGCLAAALLERGDHLVTICARTPFDVLEFDHAGATSHYPVRCLVDAGAAGEVDVVVLATKTHQTDAAQPWLDALCGSRTVVIAAQNGVEHYERLGHRIGPATLCPAIVFMPSSRRGPGHASLDGRSTLVVPDDDAGAVAAAVFDGSFVKIKPSDDWLSDAWTKLLSNCAGGAITTLARGSNRLLQDPDAAALARDLMSEVVAVGAAEGARFDDGIIDLVLTGIQANAGDHLSSIVVDRIAGRPTEWQQRNEVVVRKAADHGIDVPLNKAMTTLMRLGEPKE